MNCYLCDKQKYCIWVQDCLTYITLLADWPKFEMVILGLVHNEFIFLCVFDTLGLEVTNTPATAKVLVSNLTGPVFFSNIADSFFVLSALIYFSCL